MQEILTTFRVCARLWTVLVCVLAAASAIGVAPRLAAAATNFNVTNSGQSAFVIDGAVNPTLTLTRGETYTFTITASFSTHPFWIVTDIGAGSVRQNQWSLGVTNNGAWPGIVTFTVPDSAPATLFYQCEFHEPMNGQLSIVAAAQDVPVGDFTQLALAGLLVLIAVATLRSSAPRA